MRFDKIKATVEAVTALTEQHVPRKLSSAAEIVQQLVGTAQIAGITSFKKMTLLCYELILLSAEADVRIHEAYDDTNFQSSKLLNYYAEMSHTLGSIENLLRSSDCDKPAKILKPKQAT